MQKISHDHDSYISSKKSLRSNFFENFKTFGALLLKLGGKTAKKWQKMSLFYFTERCSLKECGLAKMIQYHDLYTAYVFISTSSMVHKKFKQLRHYLSKLKGQKCLKKGQKLTQMGTADCFPHRESIKDFAIYFFLQII